MAEVRLEGWTIDRKPVQAGCYTCGTGIDRRSRLDIRLGRVATLDRQGPLIGTLVQGVYLRFLLP